jgi:3-oxoacyl-[acyl-carrier protein] reductase
MDRRGALVTERRVALVTGASRGIGRATALALAADGRAVACGYGSDDAGAKETVRAIEEVGGTAGAFQADVSDHDQVTGMVEAVSSELGRPTIVVANAGTLRDGLTVRYARSDWDRIMAVNLTGAFSTVQASLPHLLKARWGRIVLVSSVVAVRGNPGQAAYAASKAGMLGMMRAVAKEYASRGITANAVLPGLIDTELTTGMNERARSALADEIPAGRTGTPEEVAAAIRFLASDQAAYVNGATVTVDGGLTA